MGGVWSHKSTEWMSPVSNVGIQSSEWQGYSTPINQWKPNKMDTETRGKKDWGGGVQLERQCPYRSFILEASVRF